MYVCVCIYILINTSILLCKIARESYLLQKGAWLGMRQFSSVSVRNSALERTAGEGRPIFNLSCHRPASPGGPCSQRVQLC